MGSNEYPKETREQNEAKYEQAISMLHEELEQVLDDRRNQQELERRVNPPFYVQRRDSLYEAVNCHEDRCAINVNERVVELSERTFDDPETGIAKRALFMGGDDLLIDRSQWGAEGPFGIFLFIDDEEEKVESVQAKYYQENRSTPMTAELIRDAALMLRKERITSDE